jgi:hypothetical protein
MVAIVGVSELVVVAADVFLKVCTLLLQLPSKSGRFEKH